MFMRLNGHYNPCFIHKKAAEWRARKRKEQQHLIETLFPLLTIAAAEELEAAGYRVTQERLLQAMGVGSKGKLSRVIRDLMVDMRLWHEHGFAPNSFALFKQAARRVRRRKEALTLEAIAKEAGVSVQAAWRYFIRNPQKATMLGVVKG